MHAVLSSFLRRALPLGLFFLSLSVAPAAEATKITFDLPAGNAGKTLEQFAAQAKREILFPSQRMDGVKTNAVRGELTVREGLDRLLAGTELKVFEDEKTGALVVRGAAGPNAERVAQTESDQPEQGKAKGGVIFLDKFEVTGTKITGVVNQGIIPREENQGLRYEVLNRSAIERSGATSLPELFRQVSSVANFGTGTQATYGSQMTSAEGLSTTSDEINLRGLGANNTLIMINGRRMYESEGGGADISRIPLGSIERIEILPGAGSAIYGAGATAGVVNIILRKDYTGTEMNTSYGSSTGGGAEEFRYNMLHSGTLSGGKTKLTLSFDFHKQWGLQAGDRGYYEAALSKVDPANASTYISTIIQSFYEQRGTVTAGSALGIPANPAARFAAVPVGSTGIGLTLASFNATAGTANISSDRVARAVLLPGSESYNLNATIEHAIRKEALGVYLNASVGYVDRGTQQYVGLLGALTAAATSPINPFGRAVQVYMEPTDLPLTLSSALQRSFNFVTGLKGQGTIFNRAFNWSIDGSWSRNESKAYNVDYTRLLRAAIAAGLYNPFRDMALVPMLPADETAKYYSRFDRLSSPEVAATNWRANGVLFDLWGGEVKASVGAEARVENQYVQSDWAYGAYAALPGSGTRASSILKTYRLAEAVYGETTLPIVGAKNRRPLIYALDLSTALRYEKYDDFGSAVPPMIALRYAPVEDFMLRGSWSNGFQPPLQNQLFAPETISTPSTSILFTDTLRPGLPLAPYTTVSGGNPDLRPETSDSFDTGFVYTPRRLKGLSLGASYFRYDKRDVVTTVTRQDAIDFPNLFPGRITRDPASPADIAAGRPGPIVGFDLTFTNISRQIVDGWDFKASYELPTESLGTFTLRADATYTTSFRTQLRPGLPFVNTVGDLGVSDSVPLQWRGKAGVQWQPNRWNINLTGRYVDSYVGRTNNPTPAASTRLGLDGDEIPSSFEIDLQIGYTFPNRSGGLKASRWLNGCQVTLGVLNVADRAPPLRTERINQWYSLFNDPRQRYVSLAIRKSL
jgi:outer membrane receptor protein involved in Fe transport